MCKENLFGLIRKEEVVIWAGSGLSKYAGYPTGKELGEILFNSLSKTEQNEIDSTLPLTNLAEEFYRIKGHNKNALIQILKKVFLDSSPASTSCHDKLVTIPHFKTIITTNYDRLFEDSYGKKHQSIYSFQNIPFIDENKVQVFKVHGDLSDPDSIIITTSDYNNFFKGEKEKDVYWTVIKERLSTKSVLFLGYNLEDPNISVIFDRIYDILKEYRKECFLVAPDLKQSKVNDLIKKGIHYINSKAEFLIDELIIDLKENILADFDDKKITAETLRDFLSYYNLSPDLKGAKDSYKVQSLKGITGKVEHTITVTVKNENDFIKEFTDLTTGKKIGELELTGDKLIKFDHWCGGIKFPKPEGVTTLTLKSVPQKAYEIDIRFDDGFELSEIPVKFYGSNSFVEIHVELRNALITINLDLSTFPQTDINFNYKHSGVFTKTKDEIELFTLLINLYKGKHFVAFTKSGVIFSEKFPPILLSLDILENCLKYFENLRIIEQYYNVRFVNINTTELSDSTFKLASKVVSVINGNLISYDRTEEIQMTLMDFSEQTLDIYKKVNDTNSSLTAIDYQEEIIKLHGQKINLGFKKIEIMEASVLNLDSILNKTENKVRIISKSKKVNISYSKTKEFY